MGNKQRHIRVRPAKRKEPDLRKLARAIIELAIEVEQCSPGGNDSGNQAAA